MARRSSMIAKAAAPIFGLPLLAAVACGSRPGDRAEVGPQSVDSGGASRDLGAEETSGGGDTPFATAEAATVVLDVGPADVPMAQPDVPVDFGGDDLSGRCLEDDDPGLPVAQPARLGQLPPRRWILGPWYGTLCGWPYGAPEIPCAPGISSAGAQALDSLAGFSRHDIPITALHFDGNGWSKWLGDPIDANSCLPAIERPVVDQLLSLGAKSLLHYWGHCLEAADFDRAKQAMGGTLGGFYLDDGAGTWVPSNATEWIASALPDDGAVVSKRYPYLQPWTPWGTDYGNIPDAWNRAYGHSAYVNDLTHDWEGMAEGIRRVFDGSTILPAPFNEFLGFQSFPPGAEPPTLEQYYRRLHFGAMQVVMDNSPYENLDPWHPEWDARLVLAYRYYAWLHHELVPYLHSYDREAYELGTPIFRSPDRDRFATMLGDELFVNYVVGDGITELAVTFPPGEWLDYWDPSSRYTGPGEHHVPVGTVPPQPGAVPTGREPIFIRRGAIIPMDVRRDYTGHGTRESQGSLTVLIFPARTGSFRYFDDAVSRWVTFTYALEGDRLVLSKSRRLSQAQLYRIEGWPAAPRSMSVCGRSVSINGDAQGGFEPAQSEAAANGATANAWFYDAPARRLIVKVLDGDVR